MWGGLWYDWGFFALPSASRLGFSLCEVAAMRRFHCWLFFAVACVLPASMAYCTDDPAPSIATEAPDEISGLIQQLDAPDFSERQEASRKLSEAGKAVFPEVEKAADSGSREVATRAVEILRRHYSGGDLETKQAAEESLKRLAKSGNPAAAQRASDALNPTPMPTIQQVPIGAINPALIPLIQQRGIQIQLGGIAPGQNIVRRTSVRSVNGQREIEVQEGDKTTKVKDIAGGIEAEFTEKINGKETTRKIEAKDLDDLKKKDAEVARIYETYSRAVRGVQIGAVPGGAAPGGALPGGALPVPAVRPPETVKRMIESIDRTIERQKAQLPDDPTAQQRIESLERTKKRYQDMLPKEEARPAEGAVPPKAEGAPADKAAAEIARKPGEPRDVRSP